MIGPLSEQVTARFRDKFGEDPDWIIQAPGRVNLMGDHTDTTGGWVLPAAIDSHMVVAASVGDADDLESVQVGPAEVDTGWGRYPFGMRQLLSEHLGFAPPPVRAVFSSDMPVGSGVSSSAALSVASAWMWLASAGRRLEPLEIARLSQQVEWRFLDVRCGLMDPLASACGVAGCALKLDTQNAVWQAVPIPSDLAIVLCHTGQDRSLALSGYNQRREQVEAAEARLGRGLRNATLGELEALPDPIRRRARHVVTENERVGQFAEALEAGDRETIGRLMAESHASLRDDFEVSTPALDAMVRAGLSAPGCVGIRLTGAGFGGACVALVEAELVEPFLRVSHEVYSRESEHFPKFNVCAAVAGAGISLGV